MVGDSNVKGLWNAGAGLCSSLADCSSSMCGNGYDGVLATGKLYVSPVVNALTVLTDSVEPVSTPVDTGLYIAGCSGDATEDGRSSVIWVLLAR